MKCSYGTSHGVKNSAKAVDCERENVSMEAIEEHGIKDDKFSTKEHPSDEFEFCVAKKCSNQFRDRDSP
jgi:hypothetical protein